MGSCKWYRFRDISLARTRKAVRKHPSTKISSTIRTLKYVNARYTVDQDRFNTHAEYECKVYNVLVPACRYRSCSEQRLRHSTIPRLETRLKRHITADLKQKKLPWRTCALCKRSDPQSTVLLRGDPIFDAYGIRRTHRKR